MHRLADVVVGVASHLEVETGQAREAKRLAGAAGEDEVEAATPAAVAVSLGDRARDARGRGAVDVGDGALDRDVLMVVDSALDVGARQERVVERVRLRVWRVELFEHGSLLLGQQLGDLVHKREVEVGRLLERLVALLKQVRTSHDVLQLGVAESCQALAHLPGRQHK